MDIHLAAAADNNPWPWDLSDIPEFRSVLVRLQSDVESKQVKRNKELREQVQLATFTQLNEELSEDTQKLLQYYDRLGHVRLHWADQVTAYKRNRYNRGLEQVRQILDRRLPMMVTDPTGMSMEYATFKKMHPRLAAQPQGDVPLASCAFNVPFLKWVCTLLLTCA